MCATKILNVLSIFTNSLTHQEYLLTGILLFLPQEELQNPEAAEIFKDTHDTVDPENENINKTGQPSLVSKFPEIVDITSEFIK